MCPKESTYSFLNYIVAGLSNNYFVNLLAFLCLPQVDVFKLPSYPLRIFLVFCSLKIIAMYLCMYMNTHNWITRLKNTHNIVLYLFLFGDKFVFSIFWLIAAQFQAFYYLLYNLNIKTKFVTFILRIVRSILTVKNDIFAKSEYVTLD